MWAEELLFNEKQKGLQCGRRKENCRFVTRPYVVKSGDTLSQIIFRFFDNETYKIYGKGGSLESLLVVNPQLRNPHLLEPGDKINLNFLGLSFVSREIATSEQVQEDEGSIDQEKKTDDEFKTYALINIIPRFSYSRIDAIEKADSSTGKIISKLNYGIDLSYEQVWSKKWNSSLNLSFMTREFESADNKSVTNPDKTRTSLGLGFGYQAFSNLKTIFRYENNRKSVCESN